MVNSIGSIATNIYQNYRDTQLSAVNTSQAFSFDELLSNGVIQKNDEPILGVDSITAVPTMDAVASEASTSSSGSSNSDMDLNKDGQVTTDEIVRYLQLQMMDRMAEELSSEEGVLQMGQQANLQSGINDFKAKLATNSYKIGETLLNTSISMAKTSFLL